MRRSSQGATRKGGSASSVLSVCAVSSAASREGFRDCKYMENCMCHQKHIATQPLQRQLSVALARFGTLPLSNPRADPPQSTCPLQERRSLRELVHSRARLVIFRSKKEETPPFSSLNLFKPGQQHLKVMSSPSASAENKGTKRAPEEQEKDSKELDELANDDETGPPPAKAAKPNPSSDGDTPAAAASPAPGEPVVAVKAEGGEPTDSQRVESEALQSLGLAVGTRLEVMWLLEDDEKSVEKVRGT